MLKCLNHVKTDARRIQIFYQTIPLIFVWFVALLFPATGASAPSTVTITVDLSSPGPVIPPDFNGLSFETGSLHFNHFRTNAYFFDSTDAPLLTLFRNLGISTLRIGGNTLDRGYVPSQDDLDALFRFAKAANVKVIYSLRLANGDPQQDTATAKYLWTNYRPCLTCFAIGNEPNSYNGLDPEITNQPSFVAKWNKFAAAVTSSVPDVKLGGVDNGNGSTTWASAFADAETGNPNVTCILAHYEPGGPARGKNPQQVIDEMLSPAVDTTRFPNCYEKLGAMAKSHGLSYRFTEGNSHVAPPTNAPVGNHSFATALFALDYLHWWAAHGCLGVHFNTGLSGGYNTSLYHGTNNDYEIYPICYGNAAFNLGGHGICDSMSITNSDNLNLTAYAVTDTNQELYITIINREHGPGARDATVKIDAIGRPQSVIYLKAPNNEVTSTSGITLGGASINSREPWHGNWTPIDSQPSSPSTITVEASSSAIIKFTSAPGASAAASF